MTIIINKKGGNKGKSNDRGILDQSTSYVPNAYCFEFVDIMCQSGLGLVSPLLRAYSFERLQRAVSS